MKKKYCFFDIDNTLGLNISAVIPADTLYCLRRLCQQGHFVAIATGRLQHDAYNFASRYDIHSLVADGGNSITIDDQLLSMEGLPLANCKAILRDLTARHLPWAVVTDNTINRYTPYDDFPYADPKNYMNTVVRPVDIDALTVVYKITYARPKDGELPVPQHDLPHLTYLDSTYLIEPMDKGKGILDMMAHLQADPADVIVFGDGLNDISMFHKPFFSVAMGNARPQLKAVADYITDDNDKGGILHACMHLGLL